MDNKNTMLIKVSGKVWDIVWDEVYIEGHDELLLYQGNTDTFKYIPPMWSNKTIEETADQADILITKDDISLFWKNAKHKRMGKGYQIHITINTIADTRLFGTIVDDIRYYATINIQQRTDTSFHKKVLQQCNEWDEQLREWKFING